MLCHCVLQSHAFSRPVLIVWHQHKPRPVSSFSSPSSFIDRSLVPGPYHVRRNAKSWTNLTNISHLHQRRASLIKHKALPSAVREIALSVFAWEGGVPLWQAFSINAVLFASLSSKLLKALTPEGFAHAMALGTLLWTTLGWRGWLVCVTYLVFGSIVTKIRFKEKEAAGIAESRGGRRGPENVW